MIIGTFKTPRHNMKGRINKVRVTLLIPTSDHSWLFLFSLTDMDKELRLEHKPFSKHGPAAFLVL